MVKLWKRNYIDRQGCLELYFLVQPACDMKYMFDLHAAFVLRLERVLCFLGCEENGSVDFNVSQVKDAKYIT